MQSLSTAASNASKRLLFIRHRHNPPPPPHHHPHPPPHPLPLPLPPSTSEINDYISKHPWDQPGFIDPGIRDAKLSPDGIALARARAPAFLKQHSQFLADVQLIVSSPLTRALHTAQLLLPPSATRQPAVPMIMQPLFTERLYLT